MCKPYNIYRYVICEKKGIGVHAQHCHPPPPPSDASSLGLQLLITRQRQVKYNLNKYQKSDYRIILTHIDGYAFHFMKDVAHVPIVYILIKYQMKRCTYIVNV